MMPPRQQVLDVAALPTFGFGSASPMWWGTLGFIAIEATGFVLATGAYLYLAWLNDGFPLGAEPPSPGPGTVITLVLLASVVPNIWLDRAARRKDLGKV